MKKTKRNVQIGLGASSILMIFVVLCMMILSVLAYNQAKQNYDIAKREAVYEEAYRKADTKASILYEVLNTYVKEDGSLDKTLARLDVQEQFQSEDVQYELLNQTISIHIKVNAQQSLQVVLEQVGNEVISNSWKLISTGGQTT
ncbi:hypothetical protein ACWG0P_10475 [Amedibacillus sp. YH-ame6]